MKILSLLIAGMSMCFFLYYWGSISGELSEPDEIHYIKYAIFYGLMTPLWLAIYDKERRL